MASIAVIPDDHNPVALVDACSFVVDAADNSDAGSVDPDAPSSGPDLELRYYLLFDNPAGDDGRSHGFSTNPDGFHQFDGYVFPNAGSWTVRLRDASDDSDVTTQAVTVA